MTPNQPVDFNKVESLRKHMLLTAQDMAVVLGVSRMSYYSWVKKGVVTLRKTHAEVVRGRLKQLLAIMTDGWPSPDVIASGQKERRERLLALLNEAD